MKKIAIVLSLVLLLLGFAIFLVYRIVGDIRPAILPPLTNLSQELIQKTGDKPSIPLILPEGFSIGVFAKNVPGVRDLEFSSGGTLLASLPGEGKVVSLVDTNADGKSDEMRTTISNLIRPHGLSFYKKKLFVAEETKVSRYSFDEKTSTATFDKKLFDLPPGGRHKTRSITFDTKGNMYVSLGSTCDTCIEKDSFIATVLISDSEGASPQIYSTGLRNAVFLEYDKNTDTLWSTEMGRDFLGDNLPPDEINILQKDGNYGWPYCYGDKIWDSKFGRQNQSYCNNTIQPFYNIPAHSAPLGLAIIKSKQMPDDWQGDLLVAYHGSWNRSIPTGYKVVRISTKNQSESDFLTGFIEGSSASGRPVDLEFDKNGSLYLSDDKANAVYKIVKNM